MKKITKLLGYVFSAFFVVACFSGCINLDLQTSDSKTQEFDKAIEQLSIAKTAANYNKNKGYFYNVNDPDYTFNTSTDLMQGYNYIPYIAESPEQYAEIDMDNDGEKELVVKGKNLIICVYKYNEDENNLLFNKDMYGNKAQYGHTADANDSIRQGGIIYHHWINGNKEKYEMMQFENGKVNIIDSIVYDTATLAQEAITGKPPTDYDSQRKIMEDKYPEENTIQWNQIPTSDLKLKVAGTIKIQTPNERLQDPTAIGDMINTERNDKNINQYNYPYRNQPIAVLDPDNTFYTVLHANGPGLTCANIGGIFLASSNESSSSLSNEQFNKLSQYAGKRVEITFDLTQLVRPGGDTGLGCDAGAKENSFTIEEIR